MSHSLTTCAGDIDDQIWDLQGPPGANEENLSRSEMDVREKAKEHAFFSSDDEDIGDDEEPEAIEVDG